MITVFEIGAHHCEDTKRILEATEADRYYAFEPDSRNTPVAMNRLRADGIADKVGLVRSAVADITLSKSAPLHRSSNDGASSSILTPTGHLTKYPEVGFQMFAETVDVVRIDDFCRMFGIDKVDFVYMDVQGAEHLVIQGGQKILRTTDYILSEYYNEPMYAGQQALADWMKLLPGKWEIVKQLDFDVVLENMSDD